MNIVFGEQKVPRFDVPEGYTAEEYLDHLVYEGMEKKYGLTYEESGKMAEGTHGYEVRQRIDYELSVIKSMGFVDYFLIVWDFIHFANRRESQLDLEEVRRLAVWLLTVWT